MALPNDQEKAHWDEHEVSSLIDYFYIHRAEAGEGGNFKPKVYNAAAEHIAPYLSQGPTKTGSMCKTKWDSIKYIYRAIEDYRNRGWEHYDMVQAIIPSTGALPLGTHAFHPSLTTAPPPFVVDEEEDENVAMEDESGGSSLSGQSSSAKSVANITSIAISGMQGTIDWLTDMFEKSIEKSTATQVGPVMMLGQAVKRVQDVDDGLSAMEMVELIKQFEENVAMVNTYLSLTDQAVRQLWIRSKLGSGHKVAT